MLVDRPAICHDCQPGRGVVDLRAVEHGGVQALPGLRVARVEVAGVEAHAGRPQSPRRPAEHLLAQRLELGPQQALGAVATNNEGTHRRRLRESREPDEFYLIDSL